MRSNNDPRTAVYTSVNNASNYVNPCVITVCMYHVGCIQNDVFITTY